MTHKLCLGDEEKIRQWKKRWELEWPQRWEKRDGKYYLRSSSGTSGTAADKETEND